jgi:hypothetical protein
MAKQEASRSSSKKRGRPDFFISYTGLDLPTATYFREWLEEEGYSTYMQKPDFPPTGYIPHMMEEGMLAKRLLAVFSEAYFLSPYCQSELGAAYHRDPTNRQGRMVIVRIAQCDVPQLLAPISRIELIDKREHTKTLFLQGIRALPKVGGKPRMREPRKHVEAPGVAPTPQKSDTMAHAEGDGSIAFVGNNNRIYVGEPKESRKPAKPPKDQITEAQGVKLKQLLGEIMELDSASYGAKLTEGALRQKWWGALGKVVPSTTYKNYSQAKFRKAITWLRKQRARLIAGLAIEEPELSRHAAIRTIHVLLSKWKFTEADKLTYYAELSSRLEISPPFRSSTKLSSEDVQRVYRAMHYDNEKRENPKVP